LVTDLAAVARVNMGYWVASCPRPFCMGAEHFGGRLNGLGMAELGGLTETGFTCKTCGLQCPSVWPAERREIERILMERPNPRNRNWEPHESPFILIFENVRHGIFPPASIEAAQTPIEYGRPADEPFRAEELTVGEVTSVLQQPARSLTGGH
jgi:hypothetical protein